MKVVRKWNGVIIFPDLEWNFLKRMALLPGMNPTGGNFLFAFAGIPRGLLCGSVIFDRSSESGNRVGIRKKEYSSRAA